MRLIVPSLLLAIFASSAIAASSQPLPPPGGPMHNFLGSAFTVAMPPHKMMPLPPPPLHMELIILLNSPDLNLTDEQISKLARIKVSTDSKAEQIQAQLNSLEKEFQNALLVNEKNERNASAVRAEILQQKAMLDNMVFDAAQEMVEVLTPEQKKQIKLSLDKRELFPFSAGHRVNLDKSIKCPKREP